MPRTTRIDMHSHTRGSDGTGTAKQIVKYAVEAGLHGLCLTDHHTNYYDDNQEIWRVADALRDAGVFPIVGVEYSTAQGHLLLFGVTVPKKHFGMYPNMQDVIDWTNHHGGACVVPHPFKGYQRSLRPRSGKLADSEIFNLTGLAGIEGYNGQVEQRTPHINETARQAAEMMGLPITAGSDAHFPNDLGTVYTQFEGRVRGERKFLEILKAGDFRPCINERLLFKREQEREKRDKAARRFSAHVAVPPAPQRQMTLIQSRPWEGPEDDARAERDELDLIIDQFATDYPIDDDEGFAPYYFEE